MRLALGILVALLVMSPGTSLAQTGDPSGDDARITLEVNLFGTADSLADDRKFQTKFLTFAEVGSTFASYPKPSRATGFPSLDVGGTFQVTRWLGVGVSYNRTEYEDAAGLEATIPHPTFLNSAATQTGVTREPLTRTEGATNVFVAVVPVRINRVEWRLVGGPTIFSFKADMVKEVLYAQTHNPSSPQQTITINGFTTSEVEATKLGIHAGTDVTFFLTRVVGVGGGIRFSYGTVTIDQEPLSALTQEIRVGSTAGFDGLRFRLGR